MIREAAADTMSVTNREFVSVRRISELGGVDLFKARFVTRSSRPHFHREVEIGVVVTGRRLVTCRARRYEARAGSIVIFAPGETHFGTPIDARGSTYRAFLIPGAILRDALGWRADWGTASPFSWFEAPVLQDGRVARRLAAAHDALARQDGEAGAAGCLMEALAQLARRHRSRESTGSMARREHEAVQRVRLHLEERYRDKVQVGALAAMSGLSVCQLIRVFGSATGLPPYAFLEQVRINRAAALLREGMPVSQVAFQTGFADQSHLTRLFKRLVGVPPGRYRRSALLACPAERAAS